MTKRKMRAIYLLLLSVFLTFSPIRAYATAEELAAEAESRKAIGVASDSWKGWPKGPVNGADGAFLMDLDTGAELYSKNPEKLAYPASITKLMTALLTTENCAMDEQVEFSRNAVYSIERGSSNVGIDMGQSMTVEECLYCLLLASANEVANALAEHVAGSVEAFGEMMTARAAELGCVNTHFVNPNGLHDENHYTCARDMALIARAFAQNPKLLEISGTLSYSVHPTEHQPDEFTISNHHRMLPGCLLGKRYIYENAIGGKTGFTVAARETLVTFAEKDGMRLIAVVLREEPYYHYSDTEALFEYGFSEFKRLEIKEALKEAEGFELPEGQEVGEGMVTLPAGAALNDCEIVTEADRVTIKSEGRLLGSAELITPEPEEEPLPVRDLSETPEEGLPAGASPEGASPEGETATVTQEMSPEKEASGGDTFPAWVIIGIVLAGLAVLGAGIVSTKEAQKRRAAELKRRELMERRRRRMEEWAAEDEEVWE